MPSDRRRILELALESLEHRKKEIEREIAEITRDLRGGAAAKSIVAASKERPGQTGSRLRFSDEERIRRSQRMKAYWDNWRKKKNQQS